MSGYINGWLSKLLIFVSASKRQYSSVTVLLKNYTSAWKMFFVKGFRYNYFSLIVHIHKRLKTGCITLHVSPTSPQTSIPAIYLLHTCTSYFSKTVTEMDQSWRYTFAIFHYQTRPRSESGLLRYYIRNPHTHKVQWKPCSCYSIYTFLHILSCNHTYFRGWWV